MFYQGILVQTDRDFPSFHLHPQHYFCRMKLTQLRPVFLAILAFIVASTSQAQKTSRKQFPGTKISMMVPDSFKYAVRFNGFESPKQGLSFMLSDIHMGIEHNVNGFTAEKLKIQSVDLINKEEIKKPDAPVGYLYTMKLKLRKEPYVKFVYMMGDSSHTNMISGFVPEADSSLITGIKELMHSILYDPNAIENPWDALEFTIDLSQTDLKFTKFGAGGTVYSKDGTYPSKGIDHTAILVGTSIRSFSPHARRDIALRRLHTLPLADTLIVSKEDSVVIDGLPGYEFTASGLTKEKVNETVYLVVLFENDQKYYILACNTNVNIDKNLALFRKVVRTFKRK